MSRGVGELGGDSAAEGLREAALAYAMRGWPVFPCRVDKRPRSKHGFKDASCDPLVVGDWWRRWPRASIGIATGAAGLVVVDVDVKNGAEGDVSWRGLVADLGDDLERTASVLTPSGGRHFYYLAGSTEVACSASRLASGIDVRAAGGYVIAPPSVGASVLAYKWLAGHGPEHLCELPPALRVRLSETGASAVAGTASAGPFSSGERNHRLTSIAGSMRRDGLSEAAIEAALLEENATRCLPPLPVAEVRKIAGSVARYPPGKGPACTSLTDTGNAERLIAAQGDRLRYCAAWNSWLLYDGRRWRTDDALAVEDLVKHAHLAIYDEISAAGDGGVRKVVTNHARRSESAARRRATLECARSDPRLVVRPPEFDGDPWLLNCLNGTLDLRTGLLRPHASADLITKLVPIAYDPEAELPRWRQFLEETAGGDAELQAFLARAVGYSLCGDTREEVLFFVHGPTASGKSTFIEACKTILGDYARTADFESFLRRTYVGGARSDIARLAGARLVTSVEVDEGKRLAEGVLKMLTGGDLITARHLYQGEFEFRPQMKLWLVANHAPQVSDRDAAMWRRILRLPFALTVPEERRDPRLKAMLSDPDVAGPALLAWAVRGCRDWREGGLRVPAAIRDATTQLRLEMDPLQGFFAESCQFGADLSTPAAALREAYEIWARENGERHLVGGKTWGERLRERGCERANRCHAKAWLGIGLAVPEGNREPQEPCSPQSSMRSRTPKEVT